MHVDARLQSAWPSRMRRLQKLAGTAALAAVMTASATSIHAFADGSLLAQATTARSTQAPPPSSTFLRVSGINILYGQQSIKLRGVNHNNLPALCARRGENFGSCNIEDINIGEDDYRRMSELGVNHVRFGMSFSWYRNDRDKMFRVLDAHVAMARRHRLWIVWNLFTLPGDCYEGYSRSCPFWSNADEQAGFRQFWVDLARRYAGEPAIAAYGLLNEPTPGHRGNWFGLAQSVRDAITEVNPRAIIAFGATSSGRFQAPLNGNNILYEVHDYLPMALTHAKDGSVSYPGEVADWDGTRVRWDKNSLMGRGHARANLRDRLSLDWARRSGVPVYVGEWGTTNVYKGYLEFIRDRAVLYTTVLDVHHAFFVWRSDANTWGLFPYQGPLVPHNQELLEAAATSWAGAIRPSF